MLALKESCLHPYTGQPYITSISDDGAVESTHTFVLQFESTDERDYFLLHDPAFSQFQKDLAPLTEAINSAAVELGIIDPEITNPVVVTPDP